MDLRDEKFLIEEVQTNPSAYARIFDAYYGKIFAYALRRTNDISLAEDIASETFLRGYEKISTYEWRNVPFSSWLYRIAGNLMHDYFRAKGNSNASLDRFLEDTGLDIEDSRVLLDELQNAEDELLKNKIFKKVVAHMKELPEHYQEVLSLRFFEEKKVREIADIVDKPEGTVKSLLSRGLTDLRERLKGEGEILQLFADESFIQE